MLVAGFACLCLLVNPVGYVGGGSDDSHYLEAARCWVSQGAPCVPTSHWWARWPVVAGTATGSFLLGESRLSIGLGAFAAWVLALSMAGYLGRLWFDRATGVLIAAFLAATPVVTSAALQPSADVMELAFQLSALVLATLAVQRQSALHAIMAGVAAALAVQTRETSLLFCGISGLAWLFLPARQRMVLLWALAGFCLAMAAEMLVYWHATGDPFLRWRLSLGHVRIPSAELSPAVDTRESPLFNPAYISGWKREMGIRIWWPIDPWLNLLSSPRTGFAFVAALLAVAVGGRLLRWQAVRKLQLFCGGAILVSLLLVYGLAVDPKPRMFLLLLTAAVMVTAAVVVRSLDRGRPLVPGTIAGLSLLCGVYFLSMVGQTRDAEQVAERWVVQYPGQIEIDAKTRTWLTLVPGVPALAEAGSGRPLRLATSDRGCEALQKSASLRPPLLVSRAGQRGKVELCLFAFKQVS